MKIKYVFVDGVVLMSASDRIKGRDPTVNLFSRRMMMNRVTLN